MLPAQPAESYRAYLILVEGPGDYYFAPEGVLAIAADGGHTVYSLDSRHNFLRAALLRSPLERLLADGALYRGALIKLEDLSAFRARTGLEGAPVNALLRALFEENRRRHAYLARHV